MKNEEYIEAYEKPSLKVIQVAIEGVLAVSNLENLEEDEETGW